MQFLETSFVPQEANLSGVQLNMPIVIVYKNGKFVQKTDGTNPSLVSTIQNMIVNNGGYLITTPATPAPKYDFKKLMLKNYVKQILNLFVVK